MTGDEVQSSADQRATGNYIDRQCPQRRSGARTGRSILRYHVQETQVATDLDRVVRCLRKASAHIQVPPRKPFQPYLFNALRPYYDTSLARFLLIPPKKVRGYSSRRTVSGPTEPWLDLEMDRAVRDSSKNSARQSKKRVAQPSQAGKPGARGVGSGAGSRGVGSRAVAGYVGSGAVAGCVGSGAGARCVGSGAGEVQTTQAQPVQPGCNTSRQPVTCAIIVYSQHLPRSGTRLK